MSVLKYSFSMLVILLSLQTATYAASCPAPTIEDNLDIHVSCLALDGELYSLTLDHVQGSSLSWELNLDSVDSANCEWNSQTCVTMTQDHLNLTLPKMSIDGHENVVILDWQPTEANELSWTYQRHSKGISRAGATTGSNSYGVLAPIKPVTVTEGEYYKDLFILYVVGSDLESGQGAAATTDFLEMQKAYANIGSAVNFDMIIAFGGAKKDHWDGVKYATLQQLMKDAQDKVFGNSDDYLYVEPRAHMGDQSTLKHFLKYVAEGYKNYNQQILIMWDHGASYEGFGNDENFGNDALQLAEIDFALKNSGIGKLDLIGFDACLMASMETAKFVHPYADYLLASEELEPGHGWNWTHVLTALVTETSITSYAKSIIDNFVLDNAHPYKSDRKTLSLLDLSQYQTVANKLDQFSISITKALENNTQTKAFTHAIQGVERFGREEKEDKEVSIDLKHFLNLLEKANTTEKELTELKQSLDKFILHTKTDNTVSNGLGVSINSFNLAPEIKTKTSKPHNYSTADAYQVSDAVWKMQDVWQKYKKADTTSPTVVQQGVTRSSKVNTVEAKIRNALMALNDPTYMALNVEAQTEIVDTIAEDVSFFSGNELMTAIQEEIAWYAEEQVFADYVDSNIRSKRNTPNQLSFLTGERGQFVKKRLTRDGLTTANGLLATFQDDNLSKVNTYFGNIVDYEIEQEDGVIKHGKTFTIVAQLPSEATENKGEYFTPEWNQHWYLMDFDPELDFEWLPLLFKNTYIENGKRLTSYVAEIDYINSAEDYSKRTNYFEDEEGNRVDYATMSLIFDEANTLVEHNITTYTYQYDTNDPDEEPSTLFNKVSHKLKLGDKIRFYAPEFDLADNSASTFISNPPKYWSATSNLIEIVQHPEFFVDKLEFVDDNDKLYQYYYTMQAIDIAGNSTFTELKALSASE